MSQRILRKLDATTLHKVANFQHSKEPVESEKRKHIVDAVKSDIEEAAVKHLVKVMKRDQLQEAVETLGIDHGQNNPNNSMVLSKRLKESMLEHGIHSWIGSCENENVIRQMAKALEIRGFTSLGIRVLRKSIEEELDIIGSQIVFGSLNLALLRECCIGMDIENAQSASSKTPLLQAMTLGLPIAAPQKTKKRGTRKPKFTEIDDVDATYDQLFQHYFVGQLVSWCKENGLKSSGNKKTIINRILAYHAGDKENTMADPTKVNRPKSTKKKAPAKEAPAPTRVSNRKQKAVEDEEMTNAEEAESSSEEERVEEPQESVEEDESVDVAMSELSEEEEDPEHPTSLDNLLVALGTKLKSIKKSEVPDLIERNGGNFYADKKISSAVNVLILSEAQIASGKFDRLQAKGTKLVTEDFLKNLK